MIDSNAQIKNNFSSHKSVMWQNLHVDLVICIFTEPHERKFEKDAGRRLYSKTLVRNSMRHYRMSRPCDIAICHFHMAFQYSAALILIQLPGNGPEQPETNHPDSFSSWIYPGLTLAAASIWGMN